MKTAAMVLAFTVLPQAAALATEVDIGVEVRTPNARVAVAASNGPAVWEPARWENHNGRWVRREGYWRVAPPPAPAEPVVYREPAPVVYAEVPPPPVMVESRPLPPHPHAQWIPGYWQWHGHRHVWVVGRWVTPQPGYVWHSPRWYRHGHRWAWAPGGWQAHRSEVNRDWGHDRRHDRRHDRHHDRHHARGRHQGHHSHHGHRR